MLWAFSKGVLLIGHFSAIEYKQAAIWYSFSWKCWSAISSRPRPCTLRKPCKSQTILNKIYDESEEIKQHERNNEGEKPGFEI